MFLTQHQQPRRPWQRKGVHLISEIKLAILVSIQPAYFPAFWELIFCKESRERSSKCSILTAYKYNSKKQREFSTLSACIAQHHNCNDRSSTRTLNALVWKVHLEESCPPVHVIRLPRFPQMSLGYLHGHLEGGLLSFFQLLNVDRPPTNKISSIPVLARSLSLSLLSFPSPHFSHSPLFLSRLCFSTVQLHRTNLSWRFDPPWITIILSRWKCGRIV